MPADGFDLALSFGGAAGRGLLLGREWGGQPETRWRSDREWKTANQTIFHDRERPSHVLLPIVPGEC